MAITASMVKELREMTGAGMMDCKKALNETNGDMDAAVEFLRKNGQAKAEKKASRIAAEGVARAATSADGKTACVIEVNSETDFVAKNETFTSFVEAVNETALASLMFLLLACPLFLSLLMVCCHVIEPLTKSIFSPSIVICLTLLELKSTNKVPNITILAK